MSASCCVAVSISTSTAPGNSQSSESTNVTYRPRICRSAALRLDRQPGILLVDDFYIGAILIVGKVLSGVVCGAVVDDYDEAFVFRSLIDHRLQALVDILLDIVCRDDDLQVVIVLVAEVVVAKAGAISLLGRKHRHERRQVCIVVVIGEVHRLVSDINIVGGQQRREYALQQPEAPPSSRPHDGPRALAG